MSAEITEVIHQAIADGHMLPTETGWVEQMIADCTVNGLNGLVIFQMFIAKRREREITREIQQQHGRIPGGSHTLEIPN